jgi:GNAT acetyltransferase-like protein
METRACVRVLRTLPKVEDIRHVWESWPGNRDSDIDSYLAFLRSSPGAVRPHVLVVYRGGRPDAILVGRIDRGRIVCRVGYLSVSPRAQIMCFVYGALRGNPSNENCELLVNEILRSLSKGEADAAYMNFLREDSELCRLAITRPSLLSRDYVRITQPHFAATVPATVEEFYRGLSPGSRWQAKSKQKKLLKDFAGAVRIRCFRDRAELDNMIEDVEQVARKSYQRGLGVGFIDCPDTREWLRLRAEMGWLRAYVLYLSERPCAFWIGDINWSTFRSDHLAYDAEFANYSPGMYLVMKVIEGFCDGNREGVTEVDFALGHAQYKEVLGNREWSESLVYMFAPTLKGISLNVVRSLIVGMDQIIKKALARTNLLQKVKKAWRNHAKPKDPVRADT